MTKHDVKQTTVSFRLDKSWSAAVSKLAKSQNKRKSEIFRESLILYYFITDKTDPDTIQTIFNQKVLTLLFNEFPKEKIPELAKVAYETGVRQFFKILPNVKDLSGVNLETTVENVIKILTEEVFPPNRNNWFEQVSYEIKQNVIHFHGKHMLGEMFSDFIKDLLIKYFNEYGYSLISETYEVIQQTRKEKEKQLRPQIFHSIALSFLKE